MSNTEKLDEAEHILKMRDKVYKLLEKERAELLAKGFTPDEVKRATDPLRSFIEGITWVVEEMEHEE